MPSAAKRKIAAKKAASLEQDQTAGFGKKVGANEHVEELERRDEVVCHEIKDRTDRLKYASEARPNAGAADAQPKPEENKYGFTSFDDPAQRYVVVNFAHRDQRPKKDRPGFRLLGAFQTPEEADAYIARAAPLLVGCNMWRMEIQKWMMICKTMARQQDGMYTSGKIELLKQLYSQDKAKRDADFAKNRENRQMGQTDLSMEKQKAAAHKRKNRKVSSRIKALRAIAKEKRKGGMRADSDLNEKTFSGTNDVPSNLLQRKQDYVVASFMKDVSKNTLLGLDDPEPCCIIWRFFATYDMAVEWMKGIGARYIRDYDTEVVDNYEWLFPEDVDREKIQEMWRNPEQNKIMLQAKSEPGRVAEFEQWCKSKGVEMPVTEVIAPDIPASSAISLLPQDLEPNVPTGQIKLPPQTFQVTKLETKHPDTEEIKEIKNADAADFSFLRRPIQQEVVVSDLSQAIDPNKKGKVNYNAVLGGIDTGATPLPKRAQKLAAPPQEEEDNDGTIHAPEED